MCWGRREEDREVHRANPAWSGFLQSGRTILKDTWNHRAREFSHALLGVFAARKQEKAAPYILFPKAISVMLTSLERKHASVEEVNKSPA